MAPAGQQTTLTFTALLCDFRVLKVERDRQPSYVVSNNETIQHESPACGQTPITFGGCLVPDSMKDPHSLEAGGPAVLMLVTRGDCFLVLRKVRERDHTFQRIGIFEMYKTTSVEETLDWLAEVEVGMDIGLLCRIRKTFSTFQQVIGSKKKKQLRKGVEGSNNKTMDTYCGSARDVLGSQCRLLIR